VDGPQEQPGIKTGSLFIAMEGPKEQPGNKPISLSLNLRCGGTLETKVPNKGKSLTLLCDR